MTREVISLACGKQIYFEMVATLARSFRVSNEGNDIRFVIATDDPTKIPADVAAWTEVHVIDNPEVIGFELKLNLDHYASAGCSLFIDADCLVTRDLTPVFDRLEGTPFTAFGKNVTEGEWFGDLAKRCSDIGSKEIPVFVGALYYFEQGEKSQAVFEQARAHAERYDELGIVRLRGGKNEEPLMSIGMAKAGLPAVIDDGTIKCDVMNFTGKVSIDVLRKSVTFRQPKRDILLAPACEYEEASPAIAHFNDAYTGMWEYRKEASCLRLVQGSGLPAPFARPISTLAVALPGMLKEGAKNSLRPIYHRLFGTRKVKQNERL